MLHELAVGLRFLVRLPSFLRHPITVEAAATILRGRLERRDASFLAIARTAIYSNPGSPYGKLLSLAGCEHGDLTRLVDQNGVEGALSILLRHGVYLTVEEFKGRRKIVRGSATIDVDPRGFRNPSSTGHVALQTGGSRGHGTTVAVDFANIRDTCVNKALSLAARGGLGWIHAIWAVPGANSVRQLLRYSAFGSVPTRWFSQIDPSSPGLHPRYRWSAGILRPMSRLAGVPLPAPEFVPLDAPGPIVLWMAEVLGRGGIPHLYTYSSSAVRLCRAALDAGIEIRGAQFTLGGEPVTAARLALIRDVGAEAISSYGIIESGGTSYGCLAPEATDDVHLYHDLNAIIQASGAVDGLPANALLISTVCPTAPIVLLNVSPGDQSQLRQRRCGCPLETLGWSTHLHTIRSFEKLTAGGMTFLDRDVIEVLEDVLPRRFGGAPTDYQLVDGEDEEGNPRLLLLVHPNVGPLDPEAVAEALIRGISAGSGTERMMGLVWRDAKLIRVERRPPLVTPSGKILHLHLDRS
jgi:hypothetical protein